MSRTRWAQKRWHWLTGSLKARLIASAILLNLVLLPLIGITLTDAFRVQLTEAAKDELSATLYGILALAEVEQGKLELPQLLQDSQFNVDQSGLYAIITDEDQDEMLWHSQSFIGLPLPKNLPAPPLGESQFSQIVINGKPHFIYSLSASFASASPGGSDLPFCVHILKSTDGFEATLQEFRHQLWQWLALLMLALILIQGGWLWWTLKPLARFRSELAAVQLGQQQRLGSHYPAELEQVAQQLNTLISNELHQRQRYRNALADLAHSLKTPLAILSSIKALPAEALEPINSINANISRQLKRAQAAGNSAWHQGIKVQPIAEKLLRTLKKIYQQKALQLTEQLDEQAIFFGDEADFSEILGNLLDNAFKAATHNVMLSISSDHQRLLIQIEDDGPGVNDQQREQIFQRGVRADTYEQGHGIGLAIVKDLLQSYQGSWQIDTSPTLNGARFSIILPHYRQPQ
ncbi:GHKL domain-containing protein [Shewanella sp. 4t3-1-2LB]|uniref:ATP-binding protein n=1 Tax=Shewanella sp. 4t3-1-2LB TaxID=2817682 RepID=UPI001A994F80|nr:ATP-binding protein [Shewanella sp. 4t3-1-2LB]MBO1270492.1 GHKL domain-containing protein [Shewanella sp. 4t3-1-2LB]